MAAAIIDKKLKKVKQMFYINSFFWIVLAFISFFPGREYLWRGINIYRVYSLMMIANAGVFWILGRLLEKKSKKIYLFSLGYLVLNIILTFTDQVGLADLLIFVWNLIMLALLVRNKKIWSA